MALIPIRKYGDPILRKKATPVEGIDEWIITLAEDMVETMYAAEGVGLAAPQVGELIRLIVADKSLRDEPREAIVMVNPEVLETSGEDTHEEGCLSIPDIREEVIRPDAITVQFQTLTGEGVTARCNGLLARVILHEIDHLDGVLFIDRISSLRRQLLRGKLRRMAMETEKELERQRKVDKETRRQEGGGSLQRRPGDRDKEISVSLAASRTL